MEMKHKTEKNLWKLGKLFSRFVFDPARKRSYGNTYGTLCVVKTIRVEKKETR